MKHLVVIIVLFEILYSSMINGQLCPTGKPSTKIECSTKDDPCPTDSLCYRHDGIHFCCGDLDKFCPTKMHSRFPYPKDKEGSYKWDAKDQTRWYSFGTVSCPIPYSNSYTVWRKLVPVDFDKENPGNSTPKECQINSDCNMENDEFCDAAINPSYWEDVHNSTDKSRKDGSSFRFCYKIPFSDGLEIKPIVMANESGLIGCNNNTDCVTLYGSKTFCNIRGNDKYSRIILAKGIETTSYWGVCAIANACFKDDNSIVASLTESNDFCESGDDCRTIAAKKHPHTEPKCHLATRNGNMCCFKPVCDVGKIQSPVKKCSSFEECNIDGKEFFIDRWCNEGQYCCRDDGNMSWACPDGATQLFNEPKCNGYIPSDIHSGSCPQEAGICKYGHCCPPLKINDANETVMGQNPYIINFTCNPEESVPSRFKYAFCDPEKKKIVIMGEKGVNGEDAAKEGKECKINADCKPGYVCVSEIGGEHQCYFNPLIEEVCEVGKVRFPVKNCSSFQECNNDENELLVHQWCDEKNRHCCRDNANKLWACPDRATPLFNEPKCNGSISTDINSGSCPQNSGICKYGHCCPPSKINDANETIIGKKPYITNVTCNPEEPLPTQFKYAFCDPENNTIVIMGEKDAYGKENVKVEAKCKLNKDCKVEHVCVSEINSEHHCFFNPLIVKKQESSQFWKYVIIGAIVCAALFLIASVIFFICRMKSKAGKKAQSKSTSPNSTSPMSTSPKPTAVN